MSHANVTLNPITRERLARLIVDQGWAVAHAAKAIGAFGHDQRTAGVPAAPPF